MAATSKALPRPGLLAHRESLNLNFPDLVSRLADAIGRKLIATSGSPNLDMAVMAAIAAAAPYPAPPNWSPISLNYNFGSVRDH